MQSPTISGGIEVWDFLSVDSQTYSFSNSISIIETLPGIVGDPLISSKRELSDVAIKNSLSETKHNYLNDGSLFLLSFFSQILNYWLFHQD
ncbi:hypothetical protein Hanom_Chr07g00627831 [Helianthus anomalus]